VKSIFIGTSGYNYKDWKNIFYPQHLSQKEWLSFYSKHFSTIEINATFYGSFSKSIYQKWASQVGEDFRFAIKGSRFITHIKKLRDVEDSLQLFFDGVEGLGEKLSVVLWQFPNNFRLDKEEKIERIEKFFLLLPKQIQHVCEFRHESWFTQSVFTLLNKHKIGFVINDSSVFPTKEVVTGDIVYIRFHGPQALYRSSYTDHQLSLWAKKIKKYHGKYPVYCYFNNDFNGIGIENANRLIKLLHG
jgi:uncharacterized protein YecE (DUF72 family)